MDIFQILFGLGIFLIFLLFRGFISKIIINRLKKITKKTTNKLDDTIVQAMEGPARFFPVVIGLYLPISSKIHAVFLSLAQYRKRIPG